MTTYLDDFQKPTKAVVRGRGGFLRKGFDGPPQIADPDGGLTQKGTPKRLTYGSPSNFGKHIEDAYELQKWNERRVALGIGIAAHAGDYSLLGDAHHLATLDEDTDEFKDAADGVIVRAKDAAKASLAADRGTHTHTLTEDDDEGRDIIARLERGENLGIDAEVQQALVQAWRDMLARTGLEIVAVEQSVVDDRWRLAGTLDRLARTTRPLRFVKPSGEVVEIPAGVVIVLDLKTGRKRTR